jgi:hypothetical protein
LKTVGLQIQRNDGCLNVTTGSGVGESPQTTEDQNVAVRDDLRARVNVGQHYHVAGIPYHFARPAGGLDKQSLVVPVKPRRLPLGLDPPYRSRSGHVGTLLRYVLSRWRR